MFSQEQIHTVDGVQMVNTTPHEISFAVGDDVVSLPPSGVLINAKPVEKYAGTGPAGVFLVVPSFEADEEITKKLEYFYQDHRDVVVVGSIIAAQAYPGLVFAMTPHPGFERVAPAEKLMNPHKFSVYQK